MKTSWWDVEIEMKYCYFAVGQWSWVGSCLMTDHVWGSPTVTGMIIESKTQTCFTVGIYSMLPDTYNNTLHIVNTKKKATYFWSILTCLIKTNTQNVQIPYWSYFQNVALHEISEPTPLLKKKKV